MGPGDVTVCLTVLISLPVLGPIWSLKSVMISFLWLIRHPRKP